MGLSSRTIDAFEARVEMIPFSDCHYWTGELNSNGYGMLNRQGAHRLSYEIANGPIPVIAGKSAEILHSCDNPMCVNPAHLRAGTQADNMKDAAQRRRMPLGDQHHMSKIRDKDMPEVLAAIGRGERTGDIARRFGVSASRISMIRHGHIGINHPARRLSKPTGRCDRRMSDDDARSIYCRVRAGERGVDLAREYGVKPTFVSDIKRGVTYASVTGYGS